MPSICMLVPLKLGHESPPPPPIPSDIPPPLPIAGTPIS